MKNERKKYIYKVYHGDLDFVHKKCTVEFKSKKKAIEFIEAQPDAEDWCFDKILI